MAASTEAAPDAGATAMPGAEDQNTNQQEGEPIMTESTDTTTETVERYVVVGTDVHDIHEGRIARFQHTEVARLGAEWLNGPDATPADYEWTSAADEWDEYAAAYLEAHPEISAAIPVWAEEVELFAIEEEDFSDSANHITDFRFTRTIGMVTLYGLGERHKDGTIKVTSPDIIIADRGELETTSTRDAMDIALTLSVNLQNAVALLRAEVSK